MLGQQRGLARGEPGSVILKERNFQNPRVSKSVVTHLPSLLSEFARIPIDDNIGDILDEEDRALLRPRFECLKALLSEPPMQAR